MEQVVFATHKGTLIDKVRGTYNASVVSGVWRENSRPLEWKNIHEELPRYTAEYKIARQALIEVGMIMSVDAAARLENFFYHYCIMNSTGEIPTVDCHKFLDYVAFGKEDFSDEAEFGFHDDAITPYPNVPYRLIRQKSDELWNVRHSFYTTNDPDVTLSVLGMKGVLAAMDIGDIFDLYSGEHILRAADSRKEGLDSRVKVFRH